MSTLRNDANKVGNMLEDGFLPKKFGMMGKKREFKISHTCSLTSAPWKEPLWLPSKAFHLVPHFILTGKSILFGRLFFCHFPPREMHLQTIGGFGRGKSEQPVTTLLHDALQIHKHENSAHAGKYGWNRRKRLALDQCTNNIIYDVLSLTETTR